MYDIAINKGKSFIRFFYLELKIEPRYYTWHNRHKKFLCKGVVSPGLNHSVCFHPATVPLCICGSRKQPNRGQRSLASDSQTFTRNFNKLKRFNCENNLPVWTSTHYLNSRWFYISMGLYYLGVYISMGLYIKKSFNLVTKFHPGKLFLLRASTFSVTFHDGL